MVIGTLGNVAYYVDQDQIKTIRDMTWNSSARYGSHDRHLFRPKKEFVGVDDDAIKLRIRLSAFLGVNPHDDINELFRYEREGMTLPLTLGSKGFGFWRWVILNTNRDLIMFDQEGDLLIADVTLSLGAYT